MRVGLKQFRQEGCLSYLFFDPKSRVAALIDPNMGLIEEYRSYIADHGLQLSLVLETHLHSDHFSASHILKSEYGAVVAMSADTQSQRPSRRLSKGDRIQVGQLELEVLAVPGHTRDSLAFYGCGVVFVGDVSLIGSLGRTDFPGSDASEQWHSIREVLGHLPDETLLLPAHDYNDILFSTIGVEKKRNPLWTVSQQNEFVRMKSSETGAKPDSEVQKRLDFNLSASPTDRSVAETSNVMMCKSSVVSDSEVNASDAYQARPSSISVDKYKNKLPRDSSSSTEDAFIDVREESEFADSHIPFTQNIPLSELGLHLADLTQKKKIYVSCLSGRRSALAAKTLNYLGFSDVVNVSGGFKAWTQAGFPIEK